MAVICWDCEDTGIDEQFGFEHNCRSCVTGFNRETESIKSKVAWHKEEVKRLNNQLKQRGRI